MKQNVVRCDAGSPRSERFLIRCRPISRLSRMESLESLESAGAIDHGVQRQKVKSRLVSEASTLSHGHDDSDCAVLCGLCYHFHLTSFFAFGASGDGRIRRTRPKSTHATDAVQRANARQNRSCGKKFMALASDERGMVFLLSSSSFQAATAAEDKRSWLTARSN